MQKFISLTPSSWIRFRSHRLQLGLLQVLDLEDRMDFKDHQLAEAHLQPCLSAQVLEPPEHWHHKTTQETWQAPLPGDTGHSTNKGARFPEKIHFPSKAKAPTCWCEDCWLQKPRRDPGRRIFAHYTDAQAYWEHGRTAGAVPCCGFWPR